MPLIANRQYAISILGHEGAHYSIADNKKWNDTLAQTFCFLPLGGNLYPYRRFHLVHHQQVNTNHDPEFIHLSRFQDEWATPIARMSILKLVIKDIFMFRSLANITWMIRLTGPKSASEIIPIFIFQAIIHGTLLLCGMQWVSFVWFTSLLVFFWPFFRLRIWIEHKATTSTHRVHLNWFWQFLIAPHNIWVHYEHHKAAAVPFYHLLKFRSYLNSESRIITLKELFNHLAQSESQIPAIESLQPEIELNEDRYYPINNL